MSNLLTIDDVCAKLKVQKTTIYKWLREDTAFPRQVRLGPRVVRWKEAEIDEWIEKAATDCRSEENIEKSAR